MPERMDKIATLELNSHNLEELSWRLSGDDDPLVCTGAWLWSHAHGSKKDRDRILKLLGLRHVLKPSGTSSVERLPTTDKETTT